jgi:hypothetical protein
MRYRLANWVAVLLSAAVLVASAVVALLQSRQSP